MAVSQNGYTANVIDLTQVWTIPGTVRTIRLRKGAPGFLLVHFAAWFDKNIEDIEAGQLDDWGYAERVIRDGVELSNHASGTAEDLNATKHPLGVRNTFTAAQAAKIRAQLLVYEGCIRWGGDYVNRPDEMHFEIVRDVAACEAVQRKLTTPKDGFTVAEADRVIDYIRTVEGARYSDIKKAITEWAEAHDEARQTAVLGKLDDLIAAVNALAAKP